MIQQVDAGLCSSVDFFDGERIPSHVLEPHFATLLVEIRGVDWGRLSFEVFFDRRLLGEITCQL